MQDELIADFSPTTRPFSRIAPLRSLRPESGGAIWRDLRNLVPREGRLRPRPRIVSVGGSATPTFQPNYTLTSGTNKELPLFIHSGTITGPADSLARSTVSIIVTNRQAFIYNKAASSWVNVTPTYTAGTLAVTNGSATITGTGTLWLTRFITGGQHISIAGVWYQLSNIASDTSATLTAVYAGATASGLAYTIRRTWKGSDIDALDATGLVHCSVFNDNLYIAGTYLGSADGTVRPAVIKVDDILSATPTTTYLTSDVDLAAGLDNITDLVEITGIQNLQDGRVVISGNRSTIFYSSLLNEAVWTAAPAGRTVVVGEYNGINALGKLGNNLTLHYDSGITLAYPTGEQDPPLSFQGTPAGSGCIAPRTLKSYNGVEYFVGVGGQVFMFDGTASHVIGDEVTKYLSAVSDQAQRLALGGFVNLRWGEYGVFTAITSTPNLVVYRTTENDWWVCQSSAPIGAISDEDYFSNTTILNRHSLVGILSRNGNSASEPGSLVSMLWSQSIAGVADENTTFTNYTANGGTGFVTTDDLDFGDPLSLKSISKVVCIFQGLAASTENVSAKVSRDGGANWITAIAKSITYSTTDEMAVQFCFDPLSSESWRVYVDCGLVGILTHLRVVALTPGFTEGVSL